MSARLDVVLVARGLARSRRHAGELVHAGRVAVDGTTARRPAVPVDPAAPVEVLADPLDQGFASRAAHKLEGAFQAWGTEGPTVDGVDCLDVGASTGGFTDVLLRRGARHIVAIDVGHGQLVERLVNDPRVELREGVNARHLRAGDVDPAPGLVVADLSFISLRLVLPAMVAVARPGAELVVLVKPQFEVGRERLGPGGVVRDRELHRAALGDVVTCAHESGAVVRGLRASTLPGPAGNLEYPLWLSLASEPEPDVAALIDHVVGGQG
ncbi:MAG: TlyA family RNA methyltransferase [Cellulomonas sp.]|nr:TlyA family RNA methyltransferase [Cellulomonas sp.]